MLVLILFIMAVMTTCPSDRHFFSDEVNDPVNNTVSIRATYDKVWEDLLDYMLESGYNVVRASKKDGVIYMAQCRFDACVGSRKDGIPYFVNGLSGVYKKRLYAMSAWEIRVGKVSQNIQTVTVYLPVCNDIFYLDKSEKVNVNGSGRTSGAFERKLLNSICGLFIYGKAWADEIPGYDGESH